MFRLLKASSRLIKNEFALLSPWDRSPEWFVNIRVVPINTQISVASLSNEPYSLPTIIIYLFNNKTLPLNAVRLQFRETLNYNIIYAYAIDIGGYYKYIGTSIVVILSCCVRVFIFVNMSIWAHEELWAITCLRLRAYKYTCAQTIKDINGKANKSNCCTSNFMRFHVGRRAEETKAYLGTKYRYTNRNRKCLGKS